MNLRGVVHGVAAAYPVMVRQGNGHIVNTASLAGLLPAGLLTVYSMTKHAVVGLSLSLRAEAASRGVKVLVVCPSAVETPILDGPDGRGGFDVRRYVTTDQGVKTPMQAVAKCRCPVWRSWYRGWLLGCVGGLGPAFGVGGGAQGEFFEFGDQRAEPAALVEPGLVAGRPAVPRSRSARHAPVPARRPAARAVAPRFRSARHFATACMAPDSLATEILQAMRKDRAMLVTLLGALDRDYPLLAARVRAVLARDADYVGPGKPVCDWDDPAAREALVDALVRDCGAAVAVCDGEKLEGPSAAAVELLALVAGQDVDAGDDGVFRTPPAGRSRPGDLDSRHAGPSRPQVP